VLLSFDDKMQEMIDHQLVDETDDKRQEMRGHQLVDHTDDRFSITEARQTIVVLLVGLLR